MDVRQGKRKKSVHRLLIYKLVLARPPLNLVHLCAYGAMTGPPPLLIDQSAPNKSIKIWILDRGCPSTSLSMTKSLPLQLQKNAHM
jgi:hypothetical protein